MAAVLAISGTSKSGSPIDRLIGSFIFAARSKTLRMPEASTPSARRETYSEGLRELIEVPEGMIGPDPRDKPSPQRMFKQPSLLPLALRMSERARLRRILQYFALVKLCSVLRMTSSGH